MTKETKQAFDDRFAREMTEAVEGMRRVGVMDEATYKLTMRGLAPRTSYRLDAPCASSVADER